MSFLFLSPGVPAAPPGSSDTILPSWWVSTSCFSYSSVPLTPPPSFPFGADCSGDKTTDRSAFLITDWLEAWAKITFYAPLYCFLSTIIPSIVHKTIIAVFPWSFQCSCWDHIMFESNLNGESKPFCILKMLCNFPSVICLVWLFLEQKCCCVVLVLLTKKNILFK